MRWLVLVGVLILTGCATTTSQQTQSGPSRSELIERAAAKPTAAQMAQFRTVVSRVEPVAERYCKRRNAQQNCDFRIVIDEREGLPPNAYQTL
ncbi:MAG: peptidase M48, partial [Pseudomonadota bacterium]